VIEIAHSTGQGGYQFVTLGDSPAMQTSATAISPRRAPWGWPYNISENILIDGDED